MKLKVITGNRWKEMKLWMVRQNILNIIVFGVTIIRVGFDVNPPYATVELFNFHLAGRKE